MKVLNDYVFLVLKSEERTSSGLYVAERGSNIGTLKFGDMPKGDYVFSQAIPIDVNGVTYQVVKKEHLLASL